MSWAGNRLQTEQPPPSFRRRLFLKAWTCCPGHPWTKARVPREALLHRRRAEIGTIFRTGAILVDEQIVVIDPRTFEIVAFIEALIQFIGPSQGRALPLVPFLCPPVCLQAGWAREAVHCQPWLTSGFRRFGAAFYEPDEAFEPRTEGLKGFP
jgi:hypothetical protein